MRGGEGGSEGRDEDREGERVTEYVTDRQIDKLTHTQRHTCTYRDAHTHPIPVHCFPVLSAPLVRKLLHVLPTNAIPIILG